VPLPQATTGRAAQPDDGRGFMAGVVGKKLSFHGRDQQGRLGPAVPGLSARCAWQGNSRSGQRTGGAASDSASALSITVEANVPYIS
jgi:hypothetical protein